MNPIPTPHERAERLLENVLKLGLDAPTTGMIAEAICAAGLGKLKRAPKTPTTEEDFKNIAFEKERQVRKQRDRQQRREAQRRKR